MLASELDPVDLLAGPRGRRLCLELAQRADDDVARRVFYAAHDLDPGAGTSRVVMFGPGAAGRPQATPHEVADAISRASLPTLNDLTLMQALDVAVAQHGQIDVRGDAALRDEGAPEPAVGARQRDADPAIAQFVEEEFVIHSTGLTAPDFITDRVVRCTCSRCAPIAAAAACILLPVRPIS